MVQTVLQSLPPSQRGATETALDQAVFQTAVEQNNKMVQELLGMKEQMKANEGNFFKKDELKHVMEFLQNQVRLQVEAKIKY